MFSIEKTPPVPDPSIPCPSQVSVVHLNGSSSCICDERPSSLNKQQDPNFVDLPPNSHLSHHNTPLPSFSIRDYVLASRSKDIKTNWPFSLRSLQLCLKNGVKDVLPPFQSLDTVKEQPFKTSCTVDNTSLEKQNSSKSNFDLVEPSRPDPEVVLGSPCDTRLDNKLAETCIDKSSCRSGEENDFPSTTTSVSQSERDSVPGDGQSRTPIETSTLLRGSVRVETAAPSLRKQSGKKCRLIVKFGGNCDRNSAEDIASTYTTVPETMASKVCPVCKKFSSSSNTTLNAHIDQCLSVESTPKWTCDSKLTRHRIKPRKMRLMVDIYHIALHCTLEDLDRRNGTNWAAVSSLHTQEADMIEIFEEGTKQGVSKVHPDDAGDVGPVYIDANGTKVRILSKSSDKPTVSNGGERKSLEGGERKPLEGGKGSKCLSKKKKKQLAQKHLKYLKLAPQVMVHGSQICRGREGSSGERKDNEKEHHLLKQNKSSDLGTLRPWVCSRRRGFKNARREGHQPVTCKWHLPQDILVENNQSVSEDSHAEVSDLQKYANLREHLISCPRNSDAIDQSFHKALVSERRSSARKRVGNPLSPATSMNDNVDICIPPMKRNSIWLGNAGTSGRDTSMLRCSNPTRNHASLLRRAVPAHEGALNDLGAPPSSCIKSSRCSHEIATKAMRFSSFRKNVSTTSGPLTESRQSTIKKWSTPNKYQARLMAERDEEAIAWHSEFDQEYASTHDGFENELETEETTDEVSLGSNIVFETRKERGLCMSEREKALILKNSRSEPHCYDHDGEVNIDSSIGGNDDFLWRIDSLESARRQIQVDEEDIDVEPFSKTAGESYATSFSKSSDTECYELNSSLKAQCDTLRSIKDYRGLLCDTDTSADPTDPAFGNDQMTNFGTDEVGSGVMNESTDMAVELGSKAGPENSFPEVDPIPIPGPPGSFLPSPRDMVSDDFQGNSSLTTSRVHSSPDQHDVMDGDSSDSPLSAASTISNSTASRSDFKYSGPSPSTGGQSVQDKISLGPTAGSIEPSVKSMFEAAQATSIGVERPVLDGEYVKLDKISIARGSLSSKSDEPCCCQKERLPQAVALNHQESQLLRRRRMGSIMVPATEKQIGCNSDPRPTHLDERPELLSPISFPKPASENGSLPISKPPVDHSSFKDSPDAGYRLSVHSNCDSSSPSASNPVLPPISFPKPTSEKGFLPISKPLVDHSSFKDSPDAGYRLSVHSNCDSASPAASNPVLRLMGKNLMVVNKDEDASVAVGRVQPLAQNNYQPHHCSTFSSISPGNVQNMDCHSFHHVAQGSTTYSRDPHKALSQHSGMSNTFGCQSRLQLPQVPSQIPAGIYQGHHADCGITTSVNPHEYKVDYNSSPHSRLKNRPNLPPSCHNEKPLPEWHRADSVSHPVKEIIIIDEAPESDTAVISYDAKYTEGWRSCMSIPKVPICNASMVYAFPCYHSQDHRPPGESSMVYSSSFHGNPIRQAPNTGSIRWGCTSEGSSVLQRSPFTTVSSSSGHMMPAVMYYSPSYS